MSCAHATPRCMQRWTEALRQPSPRSSSNSSEEGTPETAIRRGWPQRYRRSPSPTVVKVKADPDAFFSNWVSGDDSSDN